MSAVYTFCIYLVGHFSSDLRQLGRLSKSQALENITSFLYYVLPKTSDVSVIIRRLILDQPVESWMPVWSTAIFGVVVLGLGLWRFQRRSF